MANRKIILASASQARQGMLKNAGLDFDAIPAAIDEGAITHKMLQDGAAIEDIAEELARRKALAVAVENPEALVVGCDQTLDFKGELLSKAKTPKEARERLKELRGQLHCLISAVCVARGDKILWEESESATLKMRDFDDAFLDDYIKSAGDALTKSVGAYELEKSGAWLFSDVSGDYFTILGLPLLKLLTYLHDEHGLRP